MWRVCGVLRGRAFDGELLGLEVDRRPAQREQLAAAHAGVHADQYRGGEVIAVVGQGWQRVPLARAAPGIRRGAGLAHLLVALEQRFAQARLLVLVEDSAPLACGRSGPLHLAHHVLGDLSELHRPREHRGQGVEVAPDGRGLDPLVDPLGAPVLDVLDRDAGERLAVPFREVQLDAIERHLRGARPMRLRPRACRRR